MAEISAGPGITFLDRHVEADGLRIRYLEAGSGDAVVSIHGSEGMRVSRTHELLAGGYRVIVFELPGFGDAPTDRPPASMRVLARALNRALAKLGLADYSLMGAGIGAKVALWMALEQPAPVRAIILLGPSAIAIDHPSPPDSLAQRMALLYAHPERQIPLSEAVMGRQDALVRRLGGFSRDMELESRLSEVAIPSVALFGTRDSITPSEAARLYRDRIPKCNLMFVYDAAHALDADRPEATAEVVSDFLRRGDQFLVRAESALIHP